MDKYGICVDCGKEPAANAGGICKTCLGETGAGKPVVKYLPYAGIGSRETPVHVMDLMQRIAVRMEELGFTLRSGGANGADSAFELGAKEKKEIYIPWLGYNKRRFTDDATIPFWNETSLMEDATRIAANAHPAWERCSLGARQLHTRNVAQVLGPDLLTPSKLVICWTKEGSGAGGTGQAIRIAKKAGIPVYDLGDCDKTRDYREFLENMGEFILELAR